MCIHNCFNFSLRPAIGSVVGIVIAAVILGASGCHGKQKDGHAASIREMKDGNDILRIDLGCIKRGATVEFCIPLERLRIESHSRIVAIRSTCACVNAKRIRYKSSAAGGLSDGVLISISTAIATNDFPVNLGILVEFELRDGAVCFLELDFLETDFEMVVSRSYRRTPIYSYHKTFAA